MPNGIQRVAAMPALRERSGQIRNEPWSSPVVAYFQRELFVLDNTSFASV